MEATSWCDKTTDQQTSMRCWNVIFSTGSSPVQPWFCAIGLNSKSADRGALLELWILLQHLQFAFSWDFLLNHAVAVAAKRRPNCNGILITTKTWTQIPCCGHWHRFTPSALSVPDWSKWIAEIRKDRKNGRTLIHKSSIDQCGYWNS